MSEINRVKLFGKLDRVAFRSAESATVFAKLRGNPYVELVHWIHQILQTENTDLHRIFREFDCDPGKLSSEITAALDLLPRGATSLTDISTHLDDAVRQGWLYASLQFGVTQIRTGHLVIAFSKTPSLRHPFIGISREFDKIKPDALLERFATIVGGSCEDGPDGTTASMETAPGEASGAMPPAALGKQEGLQRFSVDLTAKARKGEIDPIVGRDAEIRQIVDILMRRRQNNPILTGEAGVGKTAVVEGFAQRIASGDVPPPLRDVTLRTLDVGLLQAGASMKGEFEARLRQVIDEVQAAPKPVILFIDEAHTLIGAGGAAGTGDAANLLKPALARGTLRTVAATTWAEYKKYFEKDPALTRRFQVVQVDEPSETNAIRMMRAMAATMEKHHRVQILDEALEGSVRLSHRYIPARQLPDKSVSLLDTAAARVAISLHAVPAEVEDHRRQIEALETELEIITREKNLGMETRNREDAATSRLGDVRANLETLEARWKNEKELVERILDIRGRLGGALHETPETAPPDPGLDAPTPDAAASARGRSGIVDPERDAKLAELHSLQEELARLQGETPLILPSVDEQAVASVVADWTGIPVGRMVKNEIQAVLALADTIEARVIGQRHALDMIANRVRTSRAKLDNPSRPIGVFMLCGPSGVGKTETALALAEALYGGEQNLITINMSEFQEAHTVSTLKGAPPGYVGYGEGGVLTEAVRRKPYSVVLLDEVEKAHPDVHEIFFQVFDKGQMEDGEGRMIDFKNTLIILTSNAGSDLVMNMCKDPDLLPEADGIAKALREPLRKVFPAALLGRLIVIPYYPLSDDMIGRIARLQLERIGQRVRANHGVPFTYSDEVVKHVVSRCTELESGARMIDAMLTSTMLPAISRELLERMLEAKPVERVHVTVDNGHFEHVFD